LKIGSQEIAMHTRGFERMALTTFFLAACLALFGAYLSNAYAQGANPASHAQGANPAPSTPPLVTTQAPQPAPIFNQSSPNTVPQQPETPVSPETPSTGAR
jgi:hypothetical protein